MNVRPLRRLGPRNSLRRSGGGWTPGECGGGVSEKVYRANPAPFDVPQGRPGGSVVCTGRARGYFARLQKVSAKRTTDNIMREANDWR